MFDFFKTKRTEGRYPKVVEDIHNEFANAGERLVNEAKQIIANTSINEEKVEMLRSVGFISTPEYTSVKKAKEEKEKQQNLCEALNDFSIELPKYKFITGKMAREICKKYGLVLGEISQYKGFVPEKNLREIDEFMKEQRQVIERREPGRQAVYHTIHDAATGHTYVAEDRGGLVPITVKEAIRLQLGLGVRQSSSLIIIAPLKDMDARGYKLTDRVFTREIPDPIVCAKVWHSNGTELLCIITAWGDEASDEMVVNQKNN